MEEVHQVGIWNGVVVGRVSDNGIVEAALLTDSRLQFYIRGRRIRGGSLQMVHNPRHPFIGALQATGCRRKGTDLGDVPNDGQGETAELVPHMFIAVDPDTTRATVVSLPVHHARQEAHNRISNARVVYRPKL